MPETRPYRPCNGDEGDWFMAAWCHRCERDRRHDRPCRIQGLTMGLEADDPDYPPEWVRDAEGWPGNPRCTAFVSRMPASVRRVSKVMRDKRRRAAMNTPDMTEVADA